MADGIAPGTPQVGTPGRAPANPQVGNGAGNAGTPQAGNPDSGTPQPLTLEEAMDALTKTRAENAQHRKRLDEFEKAAKAADDAKLTADEKFQREFADLQTKALEREIQVQRLMLENHGFRLGSSLGISDMAAALALVQAEHGHDIKYGADGSPENLEDLLKSVLKAHPVLAGRGGPALTAGGATNPGRSAGGAGLSAEIIATMSPRERVARLPEIEAWVRANPDAAEQIDRVRR